MDEHLEEFISMISEQFTFALMAMVVLRTTVRESSDVLNVEDDFEEYFHESERVNGTMRRHPMSMENLFTS